MTNIFPDQKTGPIARLRSVDVLRGAVMLLMAIDHVRVYSGVPAGSPNPSIFFTRWITHFCVPAFVFLAGTSAFLYKQQLKDPPAISRFLVTRGIFLVLLELTVIRFFWTFNLHYSQFTLAGVIWMLGWCMVLMAALVKLPVKTIGIIGILLVIFQQVFHYIPMIFSKPVQESLSYVWNFFYPTGMDGWDKISILYVIIPWIGVMAAGYAFGTVMMMEAAKRRKLCLSIGISFMLLFIIAGSLVAWFGPAHQNDMPFLFRLLGQQKYPPSQLYLLMTLGPLIALVPFAEKLRGWFAEVLTVFGKVPLFYYLLHILLIH
ncbi:MAG TPA: heparan-alpha-glucosaminide N-acetyltransferase domain-containing protein, partial [Chitinophagaceae bacterium]|nr:heparan-alpha-glucosaminide N-acetyltransferase domain-containing protein [Chitinophagaceae bacterium]